MVDGLGHKTVTDWKGAHNVFQEKRRAVQVLVKFKARDVGENQDASSNKRSGQQKI